MASVFADPRQVRSLLGILVGLTLLLTALTVPSTAASTARPPVLSVQGTAVAEAAGAVALVPVRLARKHGRVTVRWRTQDGTAIAGSDYVASRGKLRFGKKQRTKWVQIPLLDDAATEQDETFEVFLRKAKGARIQTGAAVVTIGASDVPPPPPPPDPLLAVDNSGPGAGYVRTDPEIEGLDYCNVGSIAPCVVSVPRGTAVSVWIEPDGSSTFDGWATPGCTGTDPCQVVVDQDTTLIASMSALPGTFIARTVGPGHLSITDALDDGCNETFTYCVGSIAYGGPDATVTVHKDDPQDVVLWTGDAPCAQDVLSCTIRAGRELVATITTPTQTLTADGFGGGTGTITGPGLSCTYTAGVLTGDCIGIAPTGTAATVTATPAAGSKLMLLQTGFCGYGGEAHGPISCTFTVTGPATVLARFEPA
jgi:hypothetical protein